MNGKYALALILALQVSMSLCDIPPADQELVDKYDQMKTTFYKRLTNAFSKLQVAARPLVDQAAENHQYQAANDYIEELKNMPQFKAAVKVAVGLAKETEPLVERARMTGLGLYAHYLRPHVGQPLDSAITNIKGYLDRYLPTDDN